MSFWSRDFILAPRSHHLLDLVKFIPLSADTSRVGHLSKKQNQLTVQLQNKTVRLLPSFFSPRRFRAISLLGFELRVSSVLVVWL